MNRNKRRLSPQNSLAGLSQWVSGHILRQINQLTRYEPVIGVMRETDAGKSSLCGTLFGGEVSPVSGITAYIREPLRFHLQVGKRCMTLMDLSGVGENNTRDAEYVALHRKQLPQLDLVLWLTKGNDRALVVDEHFYRQVIGEAYRCKMLFVISQFDKAEPAYSGGRLSIE